MISALATRDVRRCAGWVGGEALKVGIEGATSVGHDSTSLGEDATVEPEAERGSGFAETGPLMTEFTKVFELGGDPAVVETDAVAERSLC